MVDISVVIPFYNEEENVLPLCRKLAWVLSRLERSYEVICVDDGSRDATAQRLRHIVAELPGFRSIRLRGNFGQTNALQAGFDSAQGAILITMDGDGQNDPEDIPVLLACLDEGNDVASGWRKRRKDPFLTKVLPSRIANWLIGRMTGVRLHDYGCTLKAYRSEVLKEFRLYGEQHRFIPALTKMYGARVAEVEVEHHPRVHGKSKYGLGRIHRVIFDLILVKFMLSYSTRPIQLFGLMGGLSFLAGLGISGWLTSERIFYGQPLSDRPLLLLGVLLIFIGIQFISMGILGEILVRAYLESTSKKTYSIAEVFQSEKPTGP